MPKFAFEHPITGETIDEGDDRLIGMGNPPTVPGPVGHGRIPLRAVMATDAKAAAAKQIADEKRSRDRRRPRSFPQWGVDNEPEQPTN